MGTQYLGLTAREAASPVELVGVQEDKEVEEVEFPRAWRYSGPSANPKPHTAFGSKDQIQRPQCTARMSTLTMSGVS